MENGKRRPANRARTCPDTYAGTRYPAEKEALLNVARVRLGHTHKSQTVAYALDRLLEEHGLLRQTQEAA